MKKSMFMVFLAIGMLMTGCGNEEVSVSQVITATEDAEETETLSFADLENLQFYFASGAGGWRTEMHIESDGSFSGVHSDSDMGSTGEGYPNGTYYYCDFEGTFTVPVKINDYTYL